MATILLHAEGDARTGLGHLVRMVGVAGELASDHAVHVASASPHLAAIVSELAPWSRAAFSVHALAASEIHPWSRGEAIASELVSHAKALGAELVVSDGKATFPSESFAPLRGQARVVLVDNVETAPDAYDVLVLPTCHSDPAIVARVGAAKVRTGPAWTFVHPAVKAAAERPPASPSGVFVSMGGADPNGLTGRAIAHLLATTSQPIVAVVGPANARRSELEARAKREPRLRLVSGSPACQDALASSEWALCAFGITAYEAVALGVPLVVVAHEGGVDGDIGRFAEAFSSQVFPVRSVDESAAPHPESAETSRPGAWSLAPHLASLVGPCGP